MSEVPGVDRWIEGTPDMPPAPARPLLEPGYCWTCRAWRVLERDGYATRICRTCGADPRAHEPTRCAWCDHELPPGRGLAVRRRDGSLALACSSWCGAKVAQADGQH